MSKSKDKPLVRRTFTVFLTPAEWKLTEKRGGRTKSAFMRLAIGLAAEKVAGEKEGK